MRRALTLAVLVGAAAAMAGADEPPTKPSAAQRHKAKRELSRNLKEIGLGLHNHESAHNKLPAGAGYADRVGKPLLSWRVAILPFVNQEKLWRQFRTDEPWDSEHNLKVVAANPMPEVYRTPGLATPDKQTRLQGFVAADKSAPAPAFTRTEGVTLISIPDGTSRTLFVTVARRPVAWTEPADMPYSPGADLRELLAFDPDGRTPLKALFGDGSILELRPDIAAKTLEALVTRDGGEVIADADWKAK